MKISLLKSLTVFVVVLVGLIRLGNGDEPRDKLQVGIAVEEITPPVRVYPVRKHMIVYTVLEDAQTVYVLRVRHHRENWTERPIE